MRSFVGVCLYFIAFHVTSLQRISFRSVSFMHFLHVINSFLLPFIHSFIRSFIHFMSFRFISSHFVSFHLISSHFVSFHLISCHCVSSHVISFCFLFISFHFSRAFSLISFMRLFLSLFDAFPQSFSHVFSCH